MSVPRIERSAKGNVMSIKEGISCLVGRRIKAVIVTTNPTDPRRQVFLVLDDGCYYELYGSDMNSASGERRGDLGSTLEYAEKLMGTVAVYGARPQEEATPNSN
jgi:hypothetical protein